jgi:hypothetical protein
MEQKNKPGTDWARIGAASALGFVLLTPFVANAQSGGRHFYLTTQNYSPSAALTVCATGYHMASLWEILDVSSMTYDYDHPAAYTKADSGYGPPSYWYGWVRTGGDSSGSSTTGTGNCLTWTSTSGTDYGVAVRLSNTWETAPGDILAWDATPFTCNMSGPVWCVGDFPYKMFSWPMFMPAINTNAN